MDRNSAVAGRFYPGEAERLRAEVRRYLGEPRPAAALAVVGPHAGYIYSGAILGETYAEVEVPATVIIMCPNHTGMGTRRSCWHRGTWALPGGAIEVDEQLADALIDRGPLEPDVDAHRREHAIEVHLPFLRELNPAVKIVPIVLGRLRAADCVTLGERIAEVIEGRDDVLVVASTDMSHYSSASEAQRLDAMAIERVLALDPVGLHETVERNDISMCGYIPTTVALVAAQRRGATRARLVRYGNSGEASGDFDRVVGYAGFIVS
jgi:AmmeMemoRadiSam system protein B